jgi:hypothetical protein
MAQNQPTYLNFGTPGTTTPPTQAQAAFVNSVIAVIAPINTNNPQTIITHNMQFPAADISSGYPGVGIEPLDALASTSGWYRQSLDPNYVGLIQVNASGGYDTSNQILVRIQRPNTLVR